jgi:hypothetical protein
MFIETNSAGAVWIVDGWNVPINYYRPQSNIAYAVYSTATNYYLTFVNSTVIGMDNFTEGSNTGFVDFELFSYGRDMMTFVPGGSSVGWAGGWSNALVAVDDVISGR